MECLITDPCFPPPRSAVEQGRGAAPMSAAQLRNKQVHFTGVHTQRVCWLFAQSLSHVLLLLLLLLTLGVVARSAAPAQT